MKRVIFFLLVVLLSVTVVAPPTPHNIKGYVFHANGSGVANGFPVLLNDTTENTFVQTTVNAPPVPQFRGAYSATISGTDGDAVAAYSWNETHYGLTNATLASTTEINITLNLTRNPELNISIIAPLDNTSYNGSQEFNLTVNATLLGADGSCNVSISFGNGTVLNETAGNLTRAFPTLTRGDNFLVNFTLLGYVLGYSSITATSICENEGPILEAQTMDMLENITIVDEEVPVVTLVAPANNTLNKTSNLVNFTYNVTDFSSIGNCSLLLNGAVNLTSSSVTKGVVQNFTTVLSNGAYNWSVNCTDTSGNEGASLTFNLTLEVYYPEPNVSVESAIVLTAGSVRTVECNASVVDLDGEANIVNASSIFHIDSVAPGAPDDANDHYTNSTCSEVAAFGNEKNFTCTFDVQYFALNGTWLCNVTAYDVEGLNATAVDTAVVDPLYALNVTDTLMNFGDLSGNDISANISQNVSNIGNQQINVTVYGYGGSLGDNNAFSCATDNVSVEHMRFAVNITAGYSEKEALSGSLQQLRLSIPKQTVLGSPSMNTSYWQVQIPLNVSDIGVCNGTIVFHAELS
ncbi:MAG: hypothetical protein OXR66_03675 [Candidatus Woesearchaeota archaeon]|nr:hypothetical protein [Candidatus Woesearchaeota archaeon]